jgi:hypothetical protein
MNHQMSPFQYTPLHPAVNVSLSLVDRDLVFCFGLIIAAAAAAAAAAASEQLCAACDA